MPVLGHLARATIHTEYSHFCWRNHWKRLGQVTNLDGARFQGIIRVGQTVLTSNGEHRYGTHLYQDGCVRGELHKKSVVPASSSITRESCPYFCPYSTCPKVRQFSSSLYIPGAIQTAAVCWSLGLVSLWVNEFMHLPFKSSVSRSPAALCLSWMKFPLVFTTRCYRDSSSQPWYPRLGSPVWSSDSLLLRRELCSWNSPPVL